MTTLLKKHMNHYLKQSFIFKPGVYKLQIHHFFPYPPLKGIFFPTMIYPYFSFFSLFLGLFFFKFLFFSPFHQIFIYIPPPLAIVFCKIYTPVFFSEVVFPYFSPGRGGGVTKENMYSFPTLISKGFVNQTA